MSQADRMHGVTANEYTKGLRPISDLTSNIIGIVAVAEDADDTVFPLATPVFSATVSAIIDKAGSKGTLYKTLDGILDQADARVIVVRAEADETTETQKANVITAVKALRKAATYTGFKPNIIGAPEIDDADVTAELVAVAEALGAFVYASCGDQTEIAELKRYRQGFGNRQLMLIDGHFMAFNDATQQNDTAATIGRILGARAKLDDLIGPHKSISNTEILGVSGIQTPRTFGLLDKNSEANTINNADITTLIRENGYRVWGNRTCSADPIWAFEPTVRMSMLVKEVIASSFLWAMDKPMHPSLMIDIIMSINAKLSEYVAKGWLLGAEVRIDRAKVDSARVSNGIFAFDYEFTVPPPLENIELNQHVSDKFIVNLTEKVIEFASNLKPTTV
ncbi:phage tail protein [Neisseria brasiliensis]|uniref:phage tail sheath subtilisin-like domain-containing protein n=1 Tax=Neisseria TaxID=482 RepID=UPI000C27E295|nr:MULTISPECIES: phage tail sheath subtilisin-like domain-containing protein [Neisseria]PJO77104.1 phage tail protein [Neisseria sp. N177_16]QGL24219.1 phage tail protein [Neisseria brasiliensis]